MVTAIPKLQHLLILGLLDPKLPSWITSLNYLTYLELFNSENVSSLPPLGKLPCLQSLRIRELSVLKSVGREFLGIEDDKKQKNILTTSITSFPKLEELRIEDCDELEEWEDIKAEDDAITLMPNLTWLCIDNCPKLEGLPHRLLRRASSPSIMELHISDCEGIAREKIVEDTELLLRHKAVYLDWENLKKESESDDNSEY